MQYGMWRGEAEEGEEEMRGEEEEEEGEAVYVGVLCSPFFFSSSSCTLHSALLRRQLFHQQSVRDGEMETDACIR